MNFLLFIWPFLYQIVVPSALLIVFLLAPACMNVISTGREMKAVNDHAAAGVC